MPFCRLLFPRHSAATVLGVFLGALFGTATAATPMAPANPVPFLGFTLESTSAERNLEAKVDSLLQQENLRTWMKRLTGHPHHLGSPYGRENAEFIALQFRTWGFETEIEQFDVLFPTPKKRLLEMVAPEKFTAQLQERVVPGDSTSALTSEQLPSFNAFSIDGDVTGLLVYVNYGIPKDYEFLADHGIQVQGKVVLVRYGGSWRGLKSKLAAEHGAIGCIIFSDPHEEGYFEGDVYPAGAWRNDSGVERGSVLDLPVAPGDPLTPGRGATPGAARLALKDATTLTKIPVLPISYGDALPLLRALQGPVAPEGWRGALPVTYHIGPGPAAVHLQLEFDWRTVPALDVIARLKGSERPDQWVVRGNHHDAWVCGADDPVSGTVAMLEEARVLGQLSANGWQPKRTIIYAAWDGEEPGLIGSTEWVETHAEELRTHAVAYINGDNNSRGFLRAGGSHTLETLANQIAQDVIDPERHISVAERLRAKMLTTASLEERRQIRAHPGFHIAALGSGSDFTPFLQHLGIASLDLRFGGEGDGGSYHSIYDSFDYYTRFIDPTFDYGIALAQVGTRAVLRLANADFLPLDTVRFAEAVSGYGAELTKLADSLREEAVEYNRLVTEKDFYLAADPSQTLVLPRVKSPVPFFDFSPLQNALSLLRLSAEEFQQRLSSSMRNDRSLTPEVELSLDHILMKLESTLTSDEGLPRRSWYKHLIYAPGFYTGYSVKTIPGVREAIEERQWDDVNEQIDIAAQALERFTDEVNRAARLLPDAVRLANPEAPAERR